MSPCIHTLKARAPAFLKGQLISTPLLNCALSNVNAPGGIALGPGLLMSLPIGTGCPNWVAPTWRHHRMLSVDCRTQKLSELTVSRKP